MTPKAEFRRDEAEQHSPLSDLILFAVMAPLAGLGAGLAGILFRRALENADRFRDMVAVMMHGWGVAGFVLFVGLSAGAVVIAAWLVRSIAPSAAGSGIPRVMAVLNGEAPPAPPAVVPVKFVASTLAIGTGLALGREGPTVQMGASIAFQVGQLCKRNWADCRALLAAGAGAGFAVAFNAPIAGALFVFEGLTGKFDKRITIATLAACAVATWVGRALAGNTTEFAVGPLTEPDALKLPFFILLGVAAAMAGMLYNRTLLATLRFTDGLHGVRVEVRAAIVGAAAGAIAWFAPALVGGGDALAQQALNGTGTLTLLPVLFLVRLGLIACSVAAGTPGGLLVPFLALGAELGLWIGMISALAFPDMALEPAGFAVVGMAAIFAAIVRMPFTAIVLACEMTASLTMLLPMLAACFAAILVPALCGDVSILQSMKERLLARARIAAHDAGRSENTLLRQ